MSQLKKAILIGFLAGILTTACGFYLYVGVFSKFDFNETMRVIKEENLYGKILGLAAIPNLFVFFIFLKKRQDYRARGVLMATFLIAISMLILKFI